MSSDSNINVPDVKKDNRKIVELLDEFWHMPSASLDAHGYVRSRSLYGVPKAYSSAHMNHPAVVIARWSGKKLIIKERR